MSGTGGVRASRRVVFQGLGALGVAAALAGCGGGDDGGGGGSGPDLEPGTELASTAEVPLRGGVVLTDHKVVITQPTEGEFRAFSAVCTHQQLLVTAVDDGTIRCANHGSEYDAATGEVEHGPAPSGLADVGIEVDGDTIRAT
jgi:nitrite reductase/ring-hydroxylating ferredoxin subunit